ncbi:D-Ala-D-Ala carboxypeptidase family metallohydrolase [Bacteroides sp. 519]|uniref:D-Ala-D-Ala carboxypeptidase family metallohydrolase n=1 Tax=Bacteroides sp. 519 TaxID=2302937 RepID=UPI0013D87838|nr:D-Ala-D-Ala carboxypeptidase family metallohydrolase [Bacteroides sp. 519]NDV57676.1 peptidase M15 [Bacteroides sp. 519]
MTHFTLPELCRSATARKYKINNECSLDHIQKLTSLVTNVLDPLREAWGKPIYVNSGYRSAALNRKLKGAPNSQHLTGEAADITTGSIAGNKQLFELVQALNLPFDQLIDEKGFRWVHVSHREKRNRGQVLRK